MKKTLSLLLFFVLASPLSVFGEEGLAGLQQIRVRVVDFDKEAERDGFNSRTYKNAVELRFRQLDLPIVDDFNHRLGFQTGTFFVFILPLKVDESSYAVCLVASLSRNANVFNGQEWVMSSVDVWTEGGVLFLGRNRTGKLKDTVIDIADLFANAYFKANPPEPRSGQGDE